MLTGGFLSKVKEDSARGKKELERVYYPWCLVLGQDWKGHKSV